MADIQVKRKTSVTVTETFYLDGAPSDLDSGVPAVVATFPDGTALSPAPVATKPGGTTGQYRIVLASQPEVTWLDLAWTGTIGGQPQTLGGRVEWLGEHLFTIPALRALKILNARPFESATTWPDSQLHDARAAVTDEITRILGFSPVPRFAREVLDGGSSQMVLGNLKASRLLSVTVNGAVQSLSGYTVRPTGILEATSAYTWGPATTYGRSNVTVEYVHGWDRVQGNGAHMAMMMAAADLDPSGYSSATTVSTPDGGSYTYEPSETGRGGFVRHTGIRVVDRWLNRWSAAGVAVA
jgi:hypothetical protein